MKRTLLALLMTTVFAVPAFAQMDGMEGKGHKDGHGPKMEMGNLDQMGDMVDMCAQHADKLGLTDEQGARFKAIHRTLEKKQVRARADQKIAQIELMEILEVKDFDIDKANAAVQKISDIRTTQHLEMLKSMKDVRSMLTDEQFQKMKKMMPMMMDHKGKKMMKKHK
jgi:Spy/CpxP family protein refolding chaperone